MGISLVLLAYKEADNLRILLPEIIENLKKCKLTYEILVIDTQKPMDDTEQVCAQYGARYINQEEPFFGGAFKTAIRHARMSMFLIMDSDGSHPPKYIPDLYNKYVQDQCDVVIGSRYVKGGVTNDSKSSQIMSRILNTTFRLCLGIRAKDISTDYRIYDTKQLKKVHLTCRNYDVLQEVLLKLKMNNKNLKIGEVPISFCKRVYGESKRQLFKFILSYMKTLVYLTGMRISYLMGMIRRKEKSS